MKNYHSLDARTAESLSKYDWYHAFLSEFYVITESSKSLDGRGASIGGANLRFIIIFDAAGLLHGVSFLCRGVRFIQVTQHTQFQFHVDFDHHSGVTINLSDRSLEDNGFVIKASEIEIQWLGNECLGGRNLLGSPLPNDEAPTAQVIDRAWRICPNCKDAWSEREDAHESQCPHCMTISRMDLPDTYEPVTTNKI